MLSMGCVCVWFYFWKGGWMSDERKKGIRGLVE